MGHWNRCPHCGAEAKNTSPDCSCYDIAHYQRLAAKISKAHVVDSFFLNNMYTAYEKGKKRFYVVTVIDNEHFFIKGPKIFEISEKEYYFKRSFLPSRSNEEKKNSRDERKERHFQNLEIEVDVVDYTLRGRIYYLIIGGKYDNFIIDTKDFTVIGWLYDNNVTFASKSCHLFFY